MMSASIERRGAPRFAVDCTGQLASGSAVVGVAICDMSVTGCGIEVADHAAIGPSGVLSIQPAKAGRAPVMLPVVISNRRVSGDRARLGMQFETLDIGQMRGLIGVLDAVIDR